MKEKMDEMERRTRWSDWGREMETEARCDECMAWDGRTDGMDKAKDYEARQRGKDSEVKARQQGKDRKRRHAGKDKKTKDKTESSSLELS